MHKVKLVDFMMFGNVVRFYYSDDIYIDHWWGDDWDDCPYEHNAGEVYPEYFDGYIELAFPSSYVVNEACVGHLNSPYSKQDMQEKRVPMVAARRFAKDDWSGRSSAEYSFANVLGYADTLVFYMGAIVDIDDLSSWTPSDIHVFPYVTA